jgi:tRNA-splicing ligase RtcB (3'-phosphate/5'-hydroxy nucleic acid ligase)
MSLQIPRETLLAIGWPEGPVFGELYAALAEFSARGIHDEAYALKLLARRFPPPSPKLTRHDEPVPLTEAIRGETEEENKNIAKVRRQMHELLRTPVIVAGAIMPDACPVSGGEAVIPVGGAIAVRNAIIPSAHSADICCSLYATVFSTDWSTGELLDALMASTRFGAGERLPEEIVPDPVTEEDVWENPFLKGLQKYAIQHIADQGDGNHFAYLGRLTITNDLVCDLRNAGHEKIAAALAGELSENIAPVSRHVLVTHHGSRGLGAKLYERGQAAAVAETKKIAHDIPDAAAWLDANSSMGQAYWEALGYVGRWTLANHKAIHRRFLENSGGRFITGFGNEHNFVWKKDNIYLHGKGATPAWLDQQGRALLGLIPMNMAEPILLTLGKNNVEYLGFSPHGAGRNRSRSAVVRDYRDRSGELDTARIEQEIRDSCSNIEVRWWHGKADLSETPIAYKSAAAVRAQIEEFALATVIAEITPLGSLMAGDAGPQSWLRRRDQLTPKQLRQMEHRADRRKVRQWIRDANTLDSEL